jgi:hypothetical protein
MGRCLLDDYQVIYSGDSIKFGANFKLYHQSNWVQIINESQFDTNMGCYHRYARQKESKLTSIHNLWYGCGTNISERIYSGSNSFKG